VSEETEALNFYQAYKAARIERYRAHAAKARERAAAASNAADRIASFIPMGQPILVGHHSERRHRRDLDRINNHARKSVEEFKKAQYWAARANSAEHNTAISSRDPDAITLLEARIAVLEGQQAEMKAVNAAHRKYLKNPASLATSGLSEKAQELVRIYKPAYSWEPHPFPPCRFSNLGANIRRLKARLKHLQERLAVPAAPERELSGGIVITEDADQDSVNVSFPSKPSEEVRTKLKSFGFHWSRTDGVWYARRSNRTTYALGQLFPELAVQGVTT